MPAWDGVWPVTANCLDTASPSAMGVVWSRATVQGPPQPHEETQMGCHISKDLLPPDSTGPMQRGGERVCLSMMSTNRKHFTPSGGGSAAAGCPPSDKLLCRLEGVQV